MPVSRIFNVANISLNSIRENKILAKISGFTVFADSWSFLGKCDFIYQQYHTG